MKKNIDDSTFRFHTGISDDEEPDKRFVMPSDKLVEKMTKKN